MLSAANRLQTSANRVRVEDALAWIDAQVASLRTENILVAEAAGRILAENVAAAMDLPPFDRVAADGFALRADETIGASTYNPLSFRLEPAAADLPIGGTIRVKAGDALPRGADAVVRVGHVALDAEGTVAIIEPAAVGNDVERGGSHVAYGGTLVVAGRRLGPGDIGVLASAGFARVSTIRRPRVLCLLAGSGVIEAGRPLSPRAVYDANSPMLRALIERDGGVLIEQRCVERDRMAIAEALRTPGADIILVVGGTGSGPDDHAAAALADAGELAIHGVALRPAETAGIGRIASGAPVVLLPGAPAACLWAYEFFAGRLIRCAGGRRPELPFPSRKMTTARKIVSEIGMMEVCPVRCLSEGTAEPIASFDEAGLTSMARGGGWVRPRSSVERRVSSGCDRDRVSVR